MYIMTAMLHHSATTDNGKNVFLSFVQIIPGKQKRYNLPNRFYVLCCSNRIMFLLLILDNVVNPFRIT